MSYIQLGTQDLLVNSLNHIILLIKPGTNFEVSSLHTSKNIHSFHQLCSTYESHSDRSRCHKNGTFSIILYKWNHLSSLIWPKALFYLLTLNSVTSWFFCLFWVNPPAIKRSSLSFSSPSPSRELIHSFIKYLLSSYYVPGARNWAHGKYDKKSLLLWTTCFSEANEQ